MNILFAFAPFIVFAVLERLASPTTALAAAAAVSLLIILRDLLIRHRPAKVLEIGSLVLFGCLAVYSGITDAQWSIVTVRLCVDAGLLLLVVFSLSIRKPFTLQYAREGASTENWIQPAFIKANYVITAVWAIAFAVMVGADLVLLYLPALPVKVGVGVTIVALVAAIRFTSRYPTYLAATFNRETS